MAIFAGSEGQGTYYLKLVGLAAKVKGFSLVQWTAPALCVAEGAYIRTLVGQQVIVRGHVCLLNVF